MPRGVCEGQSVSVRFIEWWQPSDVNIFFAKSSHLNHHDTRRLDSIQEGSAVVVFPPGLHADMHNPDWLIAEYVAPLWAHVRAVKYEPLPCFHVNTLTWLIHVFHVNTLTWLACAETR